MKFLKAPEDKELYFRIDEVLHYKWDPLGVSDWPEARSEYYTYAMKVYGMMVEGKGAADIADYLAIVESDSMGLKITPEMKSANNEVAELIFAYAGLINSNQPKKS